MRGSEGFDRLYVVHHFLVSDRSVISVVRTPVAVGAKADHEPRIVGTAIGHAPDVMHLKERLAIGSEEGGRLAAILTPAFRTCQHVPANGPASLKDVASLLALFGARCRSRECLGTKISNVPCNWFIVIQGRFDHCLKRSKFEDDSVTHRFLSVGRPLDMVALADVDAFETQALLVFREEQQVFSVLSVIDDTGISANELHVPDLTFAKILENTIWPLPIGIAVLSALCAGYDHNELMCGGCNDPALLLPPKARVDVLPPIIRAADFKSPAQAFSPSYRESGASLATYPRAVESEGKGVGLDFPLTQGTGDGAALQDSTNITSPLNKAA